MSSPTSPAALGPVRVEGYAPLREYAVIGNKRTAALVAADGSIDWLALPAFDGPSVFAALLDSRKGGRFTLAPAIPFTVHRRYLPDTNVLETTFVTAEGKVRVTDAMSHPLTRRMPWSELVRRVDGTGGAVPMRWRIEPRFGYGQRPPRVDVRDGATLLADGALVLAVQTFGAGDPDVEPEAVAGSFVAHDGDLAVIALGAHEDAPVLLSSRDEILDRLQSTGEHWRSWIARCAWEGPWADAVRRSVLALDLLVDEDTGAIAAAATMGLPEKIGGKRNFDYRYAWLRDANLTLGAMLRAGYREQVHASLAWILSAVRGTHPRLQPMYRLGGGARLRDETLDLDGYRGSRPVTLGNSAEGQLQLGNYGDVFDMTHRFVADGGALHADAAQRMAEMADFVCRVWRRPDAGIWELSDREHYTQSKLACWLTLHRAQQLAACGAIPGTGAAAWRREAAALREYIRDRCWSPSLGAYARCPGSDELDAGVLLAVRGSFVEEEPERFGATVDAIRRELGAGGPLVYRYTGMRDQEGAFLACSFWVVEALARLGRREEAQEAMAGLVDLANDVGLYSEEMDPASREMLGNLPQALTHLSLINAAAALR